IRALAERGAVVNAGGGGGIPVVREGSGVRRGVEAVIDKDLTIIGQGQGKSVIQAVDDTGSSGDSRGMFLVNAGVTLDVQDLTVSGAGHQVYQGFRHKGSGSFEDVELTEIKFNESGPHYSGVAIAVFGGGPGQTVDVTNSDFSEIGRVGVLYFGSDVAGNFEDNKYTGKGAGNFLDYALDISAGADITVRGNKISDNLGVAASDGSTSAGILVTTYFGAGTTATIGDNKFEDNTAGVFVGYASNDTSTVEFEAGNKIKGGSDGIRVVGDGDVSGIELVKGPGASVDWDGGAAANAITGGKRDDDLKGGDGADAIYGGKGNDSLAGQGGDDFLTGARATIPSSSQTAAATTPSPTSRTGTIGSMSRISAWPTASALMISRPSAATLSSTLTVRTASPWSVLSYRISTTAISSSERPHPEGMIARTIVTGGFDGTDAGSGRGGHGRGAWFGPGGGTASGGRRREPGTW
ncbi:MAG: hypothetical protein QF521_12120, partial [Alphaproteobacteria bacterium]|nr:hypothetical protein [Alphaproteobacteria bacterium]